MRGKVNMLIRCVLTLLFVKFVQPQQNSIIYFELTFYSLSRVGGGMNALQWREREDFKLTSRKIATLQKALRSDFMHELVLWEVIASTLHILHTGKESSFKASKIDLQPPRNRLLCWCTVP